MSKLYDINKSILLKEDDRHDLLQLRIRELLTECDITFEKFSILLQNIINCDATQFIRKRNEIVSAIFVKPQISFKLFEFIISKVLDRADILNEPEIQLYKQQKKCRKDLKNMRYGKLTVISLAIKPEKLKSKNNFWLCRCDCGNDTTVNTANLCNGHTQSCGHCLDNKYMSELIMVDKLTDVLHYHLYKIFTLNKITHLNFVESYKKAVAYKNLNKHQLHHYISNIKEAIAGKRHMSVDLFRFIVSKILGLQIPNDSKITLIENLRPNGKDLTGRRYGRLVVKELVLSSKRGNKQWKCVCDCGNERIVSSNHLSSGHTQSCGCYLIDQISTHGMSYSCEYDTWRSMLQRCYNQKAKSYQNYGGRGITVCDRWRESFENFYEDMGSRPEGTSIERIDNDGNYEPDNCKWATDIEQANNRRRTLRFSDGETFSNWVRNNDLPYDKALRNFHLNKTKIEILTTIKM